MNHFIIIRKVEESKEEQVESGRENTHDYIRKNERIHYIYDYSNWDYTMIYEFSYR